MSPIKVTLPGGKETIIKVGETIVIPNNILNHDDNFISTEQGFRNKETVYTIDNHKSLGVQGFYLEPITPEEAKHVEDCRRYVHA